LHQTSIKLRLHKLRTGIKLKLHELRTSMKRAPASN